MDRLTIRMPNGVIKRNEVMGDSVMARLAAYEDTGLAPREVESLKAENARLRAELEAAKRDIRWALLADYWGAACPVCAEFVVDGYCNNCDKCEWRGLCAENGGKK